jgi:hypothetical protein
MLPGRNWGYDSVTINQFAQSQPDLGSFKTSQIQERLLGEKRSEWIQWRAEQMTSWYETLAKRIQRVRPGGRLFIAPVDLYQNEELAAALSPSLHVASEFENAMRYVGFLKRLVAGKNADGNASGIVFLNPHRFAPDEKLADRRVDMDVENAQQAKQFFEGSEFSADIFNHRVSWAHFQQLQQQQIFGRQLTPLMRLQPMLPMGHFNRERFAQAIKNRDAFMLVDGGWTLPMGQASDLHNMMSVFEQLPEEVFGDVPSEKFEDQSSLPLAVRQLVSGDEMYFYVVNASPWEMTVNLWVKTSSQSVIKSLSNDVFLVKPFTSVSSNDKVAGLVRLEVKLPAFSMAGGRSDDPNAVVSNFDFEFPDGASDTLRKHVYRLQAKLVESANQSSIGVIENSDFELNAQPSLNAWDSGKQSTEKVRLDSSTGANDPGGNASYVSLLMNNDGNQPVWIRSNSFDAPTTGRLSISVWLKTLTPDTQPPLRLSIEGQASGESYYRFGSVGSLSQDQSTSQLGRQWKKFAVHFDDLPANLTNVRVGFDLMGPGQVNIDNVQVFDRWFDENDAKAMTQMLASAGPLLANKASYDQGRRLLESYWMRFLDLHIGESKPDRPEPRLLPEEQAPLIGASEFGLESTFDEPPKKEPLFRRLRNMVPRKQKQR